MRDAVRMLSRMRFESSGLGLLFSTRSSLTPARVGVAEGTAFFVFKFYGLDASMGLVLYSFLRVRNILVHGLLAPFAFVNRPPAAPRDDDAPPSDHAAGAA